MEHNSNIAENQSEFKLHAGLFKIQSNGLYIVCHLERWVIVSSPVHVCICLLIYFTITLSEI